jgi:hypothetical protein
MSGFKGIYEFSYLHERDLDAVFEGIPPCTVTGGTDAPTPKPKREITPKVNPYVTKKIKAKNKQNVNTQYYMPTKNESTQTTFSILKLQSHTTGTPPPKKLFRPKVESATQTEYVYLDVTTNIKLPTALPNATTHDNVWPKILQLPTTTAFDGHTTQIFTYVYSLRRYNEITRKYPTAKPLSVDLSTSNVAVHEVATSTNITAPNSNTETAKATTTTPSTPCENVSTDGTTTHITADV